MNPCKFSKLHACDETCKDGCRVMRTITPSVKWDFQPYQLRMLDMMLTIPVGSKFRLLSGRGRKGSYAEKDGKLTHRWNGKQWVSLSIAKEEHSIAPIKILRLTLKRKWFDMIASGEKKEEYRVPGKWIFSRLIDKDYDRIEFKHGYGPNVSTMEVEYLGWAFCGEGKPEWGAVPGQRYIIIRLGRVIFCTPLPVSEGVLRINYGINRPLPRRRIENKCGKLTIAGTWGDDETHKAIRDEIRRLNPGWMITGYCLSDPQNAPAVATAPKDSD